MATGGSSPTLYDVKTIIVNNIDKSVSEEEMFAFFSRVGQVKVVRIIRSLTGVHLGSAIIHFEKPECGKSVFLNCHLCPPLIAKCALIQLNNVTFGKTRLELEWYEHDALQKIRNRGNLFISNLKPFITEGILQNYFGGYGKILSCKVSFLWQHC